jgi:hypothetical protein
LKIFKKIEVHNPETPIKIESTSSLVNQNEELPKKAVYHLNIASVNFLMGNMSAAKDAIDEVISMLDIKLNSSSDTIPPVVLSILIFYNLKIGMSISFYFKVIQ